MPPRMGHTHNSGISRHRKGKSKQGTKSKKQRVQRDKRAATAVAAVSQPMHELPRRPWRTWHSLVQLIILLQPPASSAGLEMLSKRSGGGRPSFGSTSSSAGHRARPGLA